MFEAIGDGEFRKSPNGKAVFMSEHFTKNTVEASAWCAKCQKRTQHRVDKGIVGPCLDCILKYDNRVFDLDELREKLSPRQAGLFGDAT